MPAPLTAEFRVIKRPVCVGCAREFASHFRIAWYNRKGEMKHTALICSMPCLVQWAYTFGLARGYAAAKQARGLFDKLIASLTTPGVPR